MSNNFMVKFPELGQAANNYDDIAGSLSGLASRLEAVYQKLSGMPPELSTYRTRVNMRRQNVDAIRNFARACAATQRSVKSIYSNAEQSVYFAASDLLRKAVMLPRTDEFKSPNLGNVVAGVVTTAKKGFWEFVKDAFLKARETVGKGVTWLKETYAKFKPLVDIIVGVGEVIVGVVSLLGTGGLSTPASIFLIVYGIEDIANGVTNGYNKLFNPEAEEVAYLENFAKDAGGAVGKAIGGESGEAIGALIGGLAYAAGDAYAGHSLSIAGKTATQAPDTVAKFGKIVDNADDVGKAAKGIKTVSKTANLTDKVDEVADKLDTAEKFLSGDIVDGATDIIFDKIFDGKDGLSDAIKKKVLETAVDSPFEAIPVK